MIKMDHITGMMIYYYFICQRKLWYFVNEIHMEQNSQLVELGKILDQTSYTRESKQIMIDNTINIDFIKNGAVLHEIKKTKAIEEAGIWQVKYYLYYLEKKGVKNLHAKIDYPLIRESKQITLEEEDRKIIENIIEDIKKIKKMEKPPELIRQKQICKKCAYFDFCYI